MFGAIERRINYAVFESADGYLEWSGWVEWEDIPRTVSARGFVTYRQSLPFGKWKVNGPASIEIKDGFNRSPFILQVVADEKFRPSRLS